MSKITKQYQLLQGLQLSTNFLVAGKSVYVTFGNGIRKPMLIRGRFSTSDPELQEAIEASAGFNVQYRLENIFGSEKTAENVPDATPAKDSIPPTGPTEDEKKERLEKEKADADALEEARLLKEKEDAEKAEEEQKAEREAAELLKKQEEEKAEEERLKAETEKKDSDNKVPEITDYPEVTNLQEARQKMIDLFPTEFKISNLLNKNALFNRMKDKKITFSKLAQ